MITGYTTVGLLPLLVVVPLVIYALLSHKVASEKFANQEKYERLREAAMCQKMIQYEQELLLTNLRDYAAWDETWAVIKSGDKKWIEDKLTQWIPKHFGIQVVVLFNERLDILASAGLNQNIMESLSTGRHLKKALSGTATKGIIRAGNDVYIVGAAPVTKASGEGSVRGVLVFAKNLDSVILTQIADMLSLDLALYVDGRPRKMANVTKASLLPEKEIHNDFSKEDKMTIDCNRDQSRIFVWIKMLDWNNRNISYLVTSTSRAFTLANLKSVRIRSLLLVVSCLMAALLAALQIRASMLARHAHLDELTGLYNHRYMQERLVQELNRSRRYERPLSIILLDIDHFKHINDEYGHLVGDQALQQLAHLLTNCVRETDIVARYGGEEFCVILPETPIEPAMIAAERLRARVASSTFDVKVAGSRGRGSSRFNLKFTISLGVAASPEHADRPDELIMAADLALFAAKHASRNAVRSYSAVVDTDYAKCETPVTIHLAMREGSLSAIRALAAAVDARDERMRGHSDKVALYSLAIGHEMGLSEEDMNTLRTAALLHDVGRIAIPDAVLKKPGSLTEEEQAVVRSHSAKGEEILATAPQLTHVAKLVRHHHEHYNGGGYPDGISNDDIPLMSRIISAADAFDAMTSERSYRAAAGFVDVVSRMWDLSGIQFDPKVVGILDRLVRSGKLTELLNLVSDELPRAS